MAGIELSPLEEWQRIFEVNLFGVVRGTRAFTPMLKEQGSGRIVNVASLAGLVHPPGMGSYNAVKAAVVAFTRDRRPRARALRRRLHGRLPVVLPDQPDAHPPTRGRRRPSAPR